jgi:hypothetical protein
VSHFRVSRCCAEELASGRDAEGKAWLADVCLAGGGPFQTAARLGKLDAVKCMVEELGFDVDAGSQQGMYVCGFSSHYIFMFWLARFCNMCLLHHLSTCAYFSRSSKPISYMYSLTPTCGLLTSHYLGYS